ncbi:proline--tRNA ligase [Kribbella sandramycini]|uniref:Proline--tRNA ligase n=1 Tax=Kribbella sandramycini TaxID=60450 RepID=A0A7Y4P2R3_9ACTN|nr:proline--tRNA ligase [Kribbella sandramycini]MBB6571668.1 prolyl-tRNA synthetase [Kribbella sandramycini]NOL44313.1 proline--tRNA ligase [Kribbella sandramycini]
MTATRSVLAAQATDFPRWYQDVIAKAELAENGPVRGTMVIRPYGYGIWELLQQAMDRRIKAAGAENAYFPLLIPESYLQREAEHVEGFSPELAVVTHAGGKQLEEPAVIRPTSETIIGEYLAKWVQSYRDLPLLLNQWANVVRWELRPRVFLRTTEFLWQEGHTAHATAAEARAYAIKILQEVYREIMVGHLAIPVVVGRKTRRERFAGAVNTMTLEGMTGDGKALQLGTSHELGQNFARAFDIGYLSAEGRREHAWTTSWGTSTRMLGGLIMIHGDDAGLRIPPLAAPTQVVVLAVRDETLEAAHRIATDLRAAGVRVQVDTRTDQPFGRRAVGWELKGVPIRIEVGPRDLESGVATVVRRLRLSDKAPVELATLTSTVAEALAADQAWLLDQAAARQSARTTPVATVEEALEATDWVTIPYDAVGEEGEDRLAEAGLTVRCLQRPDGTLPTEDDERGLIAYVARAY